MVNDILARPEMFDGAAGGSRLVVQFASRNEIGVYQFIGQLILIRLSHIHHLSRPVPQLPFHMHHPLPQMLRMNHYYLLHTFIFLFYHEFHEFHEFFPAHSNYIYDEFH